MLLSIWFTSLRLKIKGVGLWRAIFFLPNLLMPATVAALYFSLFSFYGSVNQFMVRNGFLPEAMQFLQNATITRGLVVFIVGEIHLADVGANPAGGCVSDRIWSHLFGLGRDHRADHHYLCHFLTIHCQWHCSRLC
jgi:hypothetical protein